MVTLGGTEVDPSEGVYTLTWGADPNEVEITVMDTGYAGEVSKTYTITVTAPLTGADEADADSSGTLTQEELEALTVAQLKQLAASLGVTLTATRKADIIAELLGENESIEVPTGES